MKFERTLLTRERL